MTDSWKSLPQQTSVCYTHAHIHTHSHNCSPQLTTKISHLCTYTIGCKTKTVHIMLWVLLSYVYVMFLMILQLIQFQQHLHWKKQRYNEYDKLIDQEIATAHKTSKKPTPATFDDGTNKKLFYVFFTDSYASSLACTKPSCYCSLSKSILARILLGLIFSSWPRIWAISPSNIHPCSLAKLTSASSTHQQM